MRQKKISDLARNLCIRHHSDDFILLIGKNQSLAPGVLVQGTENKCPDSRETNNSKQSSSSIVLRKETKVNENSESTLNDIREKVDSLFQAFLTAQNNS